MEKLPPRHPPALHPPARRVGARLPVGASNDAPVMPGSDRGSLHRETLREADILHSPGRGEQRSHLLIAESGDPAPDPGDIEE